MGYLLHAATLLLLMLATPVFAAAPMPVAVSLPPQGWLLERLAGTLVQGQILADKGQDPHTFEPTPKQVASLARARLYFTLGLPFEKALAAKLPQGAKGPRVIDSGSSVEKIAMTAHEHDEHHAAHAHAHHDAHDRNAGHQQQHGMPHADAHHGQGHHDDESGDPHIWLSCRNLIRMAEVMTAALVETDRDNAATYRLNQQTLAAELNALDRELGGMLAAYSSATFYVFHPAFGYFAHDYGMKQEAVEMGGKSPGPRQLNAIIAQAKQNQVKVIFVQPQFDPKSAQVVAAAISGRVAPLDPLATDVAGNLRLMAKEIVGALTSDGAGGPVSETTLSFLPAGESGASPVICVRGLDFSYDGAQVLSGVDLDIWERDAVCIVGPNGGGKTTLVKLIMGLLSPDRGSVRLFGQPAERMRREIGYVPQHAHFDPQFPISVQEVVRMGRLGLHPLHRLHDDDRLIALEALEEMGLAHLARRGFSAISGGQRQRVLIARALASGGRLLILDEPTANIDADSEHHFFELLSRLNQRMTVLLVTHDLGFVSKFFRRVVCVNRQVVVHPVSELTGELIRNMYGGEIRMIRHDHRCTKTGHIHD